MTEEDNKLAVATKKEKSLTKGQRERLAKVKAQEIDLTTVTTVGSLTPEETFNLLTLAIRKEDAERSQSEQDALAAQDAFVIDLLLAAKAENAKLNDVHNSMIEDIEDLQNETLATVKKLFEASATRQADWVQSLNTLSLGASHLLVEAFASEDPNE